jgi:hypothetical protein
MSPRSPAFRAIFLTLIGLGAIIPAHPTQSAPTPIEPFPGEPAELPYGVFPHLRTVEEAPRATEDLGTEIKDLSKRVTSTVRTMANRRNVSCLGDPCLVQAFPLLYNSRGSGFFGGVRAKLTNIRRNEPNLYSVDALLVRSDTRQWNVSLGVDFPRIDSLPLDPRWKVRTNYSRSTETRYFGIGRSSEIQTRRPDDQVRYALQEQGFQTSFLFRAGRIGDTEVRLFTLLSVIRHKPSELSPSIPSKLYEDNPLGARQGGISARTGFGALIDRRDSEVLSRRGWATETSVEIARPPVGDFSFERFSFIDRRYFTRGRYTLAFRSSFDYLQGEIPFWELAGIGGIDPIRNVASSQGLRAYRYGRYHEKEKFMLNIDHRVHLASTRLFGQFLQTVLLPLAVDLGRLGEQNAWCVSSGINMLFNKNFLIRTFLGYAPTGYALRLSFGQEF